MNAQETKEFLRATLVSPRSISQEYTALDAIIDLVSQALTTGIPDWTNALTFETDGSNDGAFCTWTDTNGRLRFWKTKTSGNINHQPPSNPLITEDTYWIEASPSTGSAIREWVAGIYGDGLIIVFYNNVLYKLNEPTRPFESTNIETEIGSGQWVALDTDSGVYTFDRTLSSGEILGSNSSPVQLIPGAGAGKFYKIEGLITLKYHYGGTAYTTNVFVYIYGGPVDTGNVNSGNSALSGTADGICLLAPLYGGQISQSAAAMENQAIYFTTRTGNPAAGNGTLRIMFRYRILSM